MKQLLRRSTSNGASYKTMVGDGMIFGPNFLLFHTFFDIISPRMCGSSSRWFLIVYLCVHMCAYDIFSCSSAAVQPCQESPWYTNHTTDEETAGGVRSSSRWNLCRRSWLRQLQATTFAWGDSSGTVKCCLYQEFIIIVLPLYLFTKHQWLLEGTQAEQFVHPLLWSCIPTVV